MANFANPVYEKGKTYVHLSTMSDAEIVGALQVATALWLRTPAELHNELGLYNLIALLVPRENFLFFPCTLQCEFIFSSCGRLVSEKIPGLPPILWSSVRVSNKPELEYFRFVSNECRIHMSYLEHALAMAYVSMHNSGIQLAQTKQTIAGIEKVDWL